MKFKAFEIIGRAVDEGIAAGLRRAYKHTDTPSQETIAAEINTAIGNALDEVIDWELGEDSE